MENRMKLSEKYQKDINRAVEILKGGGCTEVFLFGSIAAGEPGIKSDIDIAVRGCPKGKFFKLLGKLIFELDYPVDLVNLDAQDNFARYLEKEGELAQID